MKKLLLTFIASLSLHLHVIKADNIISRSAQNTLRWAISHLTDHERLVVATAYAAIEDNIAHRMECFHKMPTISVIAFLAGTGVGYFALRPFFIDHTIRLEKPILSIDETSISKTKKILNKASSIILGSIKKMPRLLLASIIGYYITTSVQNKCETFPLMYPMVKHGKGLLKVILETIAQASAQPN